MRMRMGMGMGASAPPKGAFLLPGAWLLSALCKKQEGEQSKLGNKNQGEMVALCQIDGLLLGFDLGLFVR